MQFQIRAILAVLLAGFAAQAQSNQPTTVTASATDGLTIRSADGDFLVRLGGDLQLDGRFYPGDSIPPVSDTLVVRRARPVLRGTLFRNIDFRVMPDFGQGQTLLYDAYLEFKYFPRAAVRAGKFKPPVGLERLQSDDDLFLVERALPSSLVPQRDIGLQVSGDLLTNRATYAIGVFNGAPDGSLIEGLPANGHEYDARLFFTPWKPETKHPLNGLGFGISGTAGEQTNATLPSLKSFGKVTFFSYASGAAASGTRTHFSPQAYYFSGPLGVLTEYVRSAQHVREGTSPETALTHHAWQVAAAFVLTGEKKSYNGVIPKSNFNPSRRTWGAWEVDVRTSALTIDSGAFAHGLADPTRSARHAREWVEGVNWYLNRSVKISFAYGYTRFLGGAPQGGSRPSEKAAILRFQVAI